MEILALREARVQAAREMLHFLGEMVEVLVETEVAVVVVLPLLQAMEFPGEMAVGIPEEREVIMVLDMVLGEMEEGVLFFLFSELDYPEMTGELLEAVEEVKGMVSVGHHQDPALPAR